MDMDPKTEHNNIILSELEIDAIGEILNISMGAAATAVSSMLDKQVLITTPKVFVREVSKLDYSDLEPAMMVKITYVKGITGSNIMVFRQKDIQYIINQLMGIDEPPRDDFVFDEMSISAACEVMNQMMGASATALSEFLGRSINISTPTATIMDENNTFSSAIGADTGENIVAIFFDLTIADIMKSEFVCVMTCDLARLIINQFLNGEEPEKAAAPPAPEEKRPLPADNSSEGLPPNPAPVSDGEKTQAEDRPVESSTDTETFAPPVSAVPPVPAQGHEEPVQQPQGFVRQEPASPQQAAGHAQPQPGYAPVMPGYPPQTAGYTDTPGLNQYAQGYMPQAPYYPGMQYPQGMPYPYPGQYPPPYPQPYPMYPPQAVPQFNPQQTPGAQIGPDGKQAVAANLRNLKESGEQNAAQTKENTVLKQPVNVQNVQFPHFSNQPPVLSEPLMSGNIDMLMNIPLNVSIEIGRTKKKIKEIMDFNQGSIIELEKQAGAPVDVIVNGQLMARGDVVVIDDNFAVRITEIVGTKELISSVEGTANK